jgi:hypothetical protein
VSTYIGRPLVRDVLRALAHPRRAWSKLNRWRDLARYVDVRHADLLGYRRELFDDRDFQAHLQRHLGDVGYVTLGPELYAVVRAIRPLVVVETGVASGVSSAHILRALAANGTGTLYSIDLPNVQEGSVLPDGRPAGWIVPDSLRGQWVLQLGDSRELLPKLLASLDDVHLFLHDSDHSYECMAFEYERAFPKLVAGGVLMSDDTHLHTAWDDFCRRNALRPTRVGRLGVTRKRRFA